MGQFLKLMNLNVTDAKDGFDAIEKIQQSTFDLVLMDILMPGIDGYETSKRIRALKGEYANIPIIAVTANDVSEIQNEIQESGMNGALSKPLNRDELQELLSKLFSQEVKKEKVEYNFKTFNLEAFIEVYNDQDMQKEIIDAVYEERTNDLKLMNEAFNEEDTKVIYKAMHYMKGSFSYLKATTVLKTTQTILDLCKINELADVLNLRDKVIKEYNEFLVELKEYYDSL